MNFRKISRNKGTEMPEHSRSGEDLRQHNVPTTEEKRKNEDRRSLFQDYNKIIETYSKIPMFENLSKEQIQKILRICSKKRYPGLHYLYHAGEESNDMYILLKGKLNIKLRIGDVWKIVTKFGIVGEMGFFSGAKRSANVITDTECILLKLNKVEVLRLFQQDKDLHIKILQNVINDLTQKLLSDHEEIEELYYRMRAIE